MAESKIKNTQLMVKEYTKEYTVDANTVTAVDFNPSESGYRPLGVVGYSTNHGSAVIQQCKFINNTTIRFSIRNISNTSITTTAYVRVLFQPN